MSSKDDVILAPVVNRPAEYIIKDKQGFNVGRMFILEKSVEHKFMLIKIKVFKGNASIHKDVYKVITNKVFENREIRKLNIIIDEDMYFDPLTPLGYSLEGVLESSINLDGEIKNEFLFGVERDGLNKGNTLNIVRLVGENVVLKIQTPQDAIDNLDYYIRNKEHLMEFEPSREESFYTRAAQINILRDEYKKFLNGTGASFGIYVKDSFIGKIKINNIVLGSFRSGMIGYSIDKDNQGKGYMKEAVELICSYAFEEIGLHRLEASALIDNVRSKGVLKGCGFEELGINKKYLFINGEWRDHITYYRVEGSNI